MQIETNQNLEREIRLNKVKAFCISISIIAITLAIWRLS